MRHRPMTLVLLIFTFCNITLLCYAMEPLLFMDMKDVQNPWGRIRPVPHAVEEMKLLNVPPNLNWTAGDTVFATFPLPDESGYEIFVAVGRPGEPLSNDIQSDPDGVSILQFTTTDFVEYSGPLLVLYLPNGSGKFNDGKIWTAKSMDRNPKGVYIFFASYGSSAHTFKATSPLKENGFTATTGALDKYNFKDHDDCNVIYDIFNDVWVEMQIMYQNRTVLGLGPKKYCDNIGHENRRVVTVRTSPDGANWTQDYGCLDKPQKDEHCKTFNRSAIIEPDPENDPPELEYYRVRPFYLGASKRLVAHALAYVPSPPNIVMVPGYGRQPLWYCKSGCCHGPHMYEQWWIGPSSGDPTLMREWRRPFEDTPIAPHDIWLMAQPVVFDNWHIWVDSGKVWGRPMYRLAGLYTASNGEFSTPPFSMPSHQLWVNAEAYWHGGNHVGGCDEGCSAYIMVEMLDAKTQKVIPGFEKENCVIVNNGGLRLPLVWKKNITEPEGLKYPSQHKINTTSVQLRFYFRDATIYAVGKD